MEASNDVVTSILPLFSRHSSILFDLGATHSFVSNTYARLSGEAPEPLDCSLIVATLVGDHVVCNSVLRGCPVKI